MQRYAESRGGQCLSKKYTDNKTKLEWRCKNHHTWLAVPSGILRGVWCSQCAGVSRKTLIEMKAIAKSRQGRCLSREYVNITTKLEWQCQFGHTWKATPNNVKNQNNWCPKCHGFGKTIADMRKLAKSKKGKCLSEKFIGVDKKLKWQCQYGHAWMAQPAKVAQGTWCPRCIGRHKTILDMRLLAKRRGGDCLSEKYLGADIKLEWQCAKGHAWTAKPSNIKTGTWCPKCRGFGKTIADMRAHAKSKNGKCLSQEYATGRTHLEWQCEKKHIWKATPSNILRGKWCPVCARLNRRKNVQYTKVYSPKIRT